MDNCAPFFRPRHYCKHGPIHLHDEPGWQGCATEARHPARHLPGFFPGAKIGVLGLNGSGKSTLLKIMAGIDTDSKARRAPQPGIKIGYLPQEPQLDPDQGCARRSSRKAGRAHAQVARFNEI